MAAGELNYRPVDDISSGQTCILSGKSSAVTPWDFATKPEDEKKKNPSKGTTVSLSQSAFYSLEFCNF